VSGEKLLLTVDIGNTNITMGAFAGERLESSWRISTDRRRMADEYRPMLGELLRGAGSSYERIAAVVELESGPIDLAASHARLAQRIVNAWVGDAPGAAGVGGV